jgi:hypothetical protein
MKEAIPNGLVEFGIFTSPASCDTAEDDWGVVDWFRSMLASCRDRQAGVAMRICENLLRWFVWELVQVVASSIACSLCQTAASLTVCDFLLAVTSSIVCESRFEDRIG